MYIQAPGDGSNGFHPRDAVADMIDDAFVPMALYLIRQARAPGCPTISDGTPIRPTARLKMPGW